MFKSIKTIGLFILILSGCAKVSDRDMAKISGPIEIKNSTEAALSQNFFENGEWPTEQWWEMFEDSQLNELIELALKESPTLQKVLAKVEEAEAKAKKERAALFPYLGIEYLEQWNYFSKNGFDRSFFPTLPGSPPIPATDNQIDLTLNFNYEIDFFGKNRNLYKASLNKARAERAEAKQATLMLTTLIVQTYIELQTKFLKREILQKRCKDHEHLFELSTSRNVFGIDPAIPTLEREKNIYEIEESLLNIDKEIILDRHMLNALIGVGPDQMLVSKPMQVIFERPFSIPADLSSDLLARRPDLMAQIWHVEAAAAEIGAAKADFYPSVNLMAFAGLESLSFNQLLSWSSREGGLIPALHLPIFTGGKLKANLKNKVAAFNEETYRYNELLLNAAREVADQITILIATFDILSRQINILETVQEQVQLQYSRYKQGINNFLTVLDKEDDLYFQSLKLFSDERDYLLAVLKLVKALGGGYHSYSPLKPERQP